MYGTIVVDELTSRFTRLGKCVYRFWERGLENLAKNVPIPPFIPHTNLSGRSSQGFQSVLISILSLMNEDPVRPQNPHPANP